MATAGCCRRRPQFGAARRYRYGCATAPSRRRLIPDRRAPMVEAEERQSTEGEIIGYFLKESIHKGLTPEETVRAIREQGGIVGVPHPFDRWRTSPLKLEALNRISDDVDVIEVFNARNLQQSDNV